MEDQLTRSLSKEQNDESKQETNRISNLIPKVAWKRQLSQQFSPIKEFSIGIKDTYKLLPLGYRMWKYVRREKSAGRVPVMDPFNSPRIEPLMGVPIGGIGSGSIGRGWRGDFIRWQIAPCGLSQTGIVDADQFSVYIKRKGSKTEDLTVASVLHPGKPKKNVPVSSEWDWLCTGNSSTYHAVFPRAWTVYEEPDPMIKLCCRQVSPVIPHNYKESSYPTGAFIWTIENNSGTDAEVSIMFSFQNGMGVQSDTSGGHLNTPFFEKCKIHPDREVVGVKLKHRLKQTAVIDGSKDVFEDPLTFAIGTVKDESDDSTKVTVCPTFYTNSKESVKKLWTSFKSNGTITDVEDSKLSSSKDKTIGSAIAIKVSVPAGESKEVVFAISWDNPIARFSSGSAYFRRYTKFYGEDGESVTNILIDTLDNYRDWEKEIDKWQRPILEDQQLPDFYKSALFNELYYLVDGGTIWTTHCKTHLEDQYPIDSHIDDDDEIGHFAYLESLEYLMYNTYDVHFYASFALAMLWPKLELSLQRDVAMATMVKYKDEWEIMHTGKIALRKAKGAVPHDMGNPGEDPWNKVNSYCIQDISRWKDLPCKFILQLYRDYVITHDTKFLRNVWPVIRETIDYALQFDKDNDGVIDNENFPDQTYDTWSAEGCSAYSGGLWLASLHAAIEIAKIVDEHEKAGEYFKVLQKGMLSYEGKLWNGQYYNYDSSSSAHHDSIMADQLAGQWYARACGLRSIVPDSNAYLALQTVYKHNVIGFQNGKLGAINGIRPNGSLDDTCMQSVEVWTGTTYGVAASMLQQGLVQEAFETAKGIINTTYEDIGYMFQTPEAWDIRGQYRSAAYMRPLAIWAMQWAWQNYYKGQPSFPKLLPDKFPWKDTAIGDNEE